MRELCFYTDLAGTVLDHDERALADGTSLLWVRERGTSIGGFKVYVMLLSLQSATSLSEFGTSCDGEQQIGRGTPTAYHDEEC